MEDAFDSLKLKLKSPVLTLPELEAPFIVKTYALSVAVGNILSQKQPVGKIHPVQYESRNMNAAESNYTAREREALAVVLLFRSSEYTYYPRCPLN